MPFLARAKDIVVLTVDEDEGRGDDVNRLVGALAWHDFPVRAERLISGPPGAVETLLDAASTRAGLLIMGGYGHSRLREWVFGGFTKRILAAAPLPVLIAH
jgi:nucleotide-binding universal stress UspA family protein